MKKKVAIDESTCSNCLNNYNESSFCLHGVDASGKYCIYYTPIHLPTKKEEPMKSICFNGKCWDCVHGTVAGDENDVTRYYVCELDGEPHDGCEKFVGKGEKE